MITLFHDPSADDHFLVDFETKRWSRWQDSTQEALTVGIRYKLADPYTSADDVLNAHPDFRIIATYPLEDFPELYL